MSSNSHPERGSEVVQLAFALPVLLLAFLVTAQLAIWGFEIVQFTTAGESVAYDIDTSVLESLEADPVSAKELVQDEIASRMLGIESQSVDVETVSLTTYPAATTAPSDNTTDAYQYATEQSTGRVAFTARLTCPSVINLGDPLVLEHTWQRDRLLYRRAEVAK